MSGTRIESNNPYLRECVIFLLKRQKTTNKNMFILIFIIIVTRPADFPVPTGFPRLQTKKTNPLFDTGPGQITTVENIFFYST